MSRASRTALRNGYADLTRISLLEEDADRTEDTFTELRDELKGMTRVLIGMLVALASASIMLALNIIMAAI